MLIFLSQRLTELLTCGVHRHAEFLGVEIYKRRGRNVAHVSQEAPLDEVLRTFMSSNNHMLIAHAAAGSSYDGADLASTAVTGLITLEDVMETLMQVTVAVLWLSSKHASEIRLDRAEASTFGSSVIVLYLVSWQVCRL